MTMDNSLAEGKPDFSSALVQINRSISSVYGALLREDEFFGCGHRKKTYGNNLF